MKKIIQFLILAWISAFIFEEISRTIGILLKFPKVVHIWALPNFWWFFFVWYAVIFLIAYFLFMKKPMKYVIIYGIIVGILAETFVFHKMNIVTFFVFIVAYPLMFYLPFKVFRVLNYKEKFKIKHIIIVLLLIAYIIVFSLFIYGINKFITG